MEPRAPRRPWGIYSGVGTATPVKTLALNLGAPGDRRDATGKLWLSYPRPKSPKTTGLELNLDLGESFTTGGRFVSDDGDSSETGSGPASWVYSSSARGIKRCTLPLRGTGDRPASYSVRLHFSSGSTRQPQPGQRVFDVHLQGQLVQKNVDAAKSGKDGTVVLEIRSVSVKDQLTIELVPRTGEQPMLSGIEVTEIAAGR
jgi:hypothetical protein